MTSSKTLRRFAFAASTLLFSGPTGLVTAQSTSRRLTTRLDSLPFNRNVWGIALLDRAGRLVFGRNADRLFMPASNNKLLVTATAIRLFPADWTATSQLFLAGPIDAGILKSDLILYGGGDPTWSRRCYAVEPAPTTSCQFDPYLALRQMAGAAKQAGIRTVAGSLIGDGSYFEPTLTHPTWESDDLVWGYAAPVSGLGFNDNTVVARVTAGPTLGAKPRVSLDPDLGALAVVVEATTVADDAPAELVWQRTLDGAVVLSGTIRIGGEPDIAELAVADPNRYAALAFAQVLADSGIEILGGIRSTTDSTVTQSARRSAPLATTSSRRFEEWVFAILNVSQNWYAETLLKQLGRRFGTNGSWSEGLRIERRFLIDSLGIDSTQFRAHDGSGLSAKNLASPLTFATILYRMRRHPSYPAFGTGMPRGGATGSLRRRFQDTPIDTRVRAKTGSLGQVNTLSGYLETDSVFRARPLPCRVFSIQANHHTLGGRAMVEMIDSVVVDMAAGTPCALKP